LNKNKSISGIDPASGSGMCIDVHGALEFNAPDIEADMVLAVCQKLAGYQMAKT